MNKKLLHNYNPEINVYLHKYVYEKVIQKILLNLHFFFGGGELYSIKIKING